VLKAVRDFEAKQLRRDIPEFRAGDTIRVSVRIVEGDKTRTQDFEGICIRRSGGGMRETFTLRRVSYGVGMERIFPLHSPSIEKITVVRRGKVRRSRLYYLRKLRGKKARVTEDREATLRGGRNAKAAGETPAPAAEPAPAEPAAAEPSGAEPAPSDS
jgi:large subunit ribosomal protein L19